MDVALKDAAIIYDFDGTLACGNLQEHSFIPNIGMSRNDFWAEVKKRAKDNDADEILVYMHLMLEKVRKNGSYLSKNDLYGHGRGARLFYGLDNGDWFNRINAHAVTCGLSLTHYIVSSGIREMIEGCSISSSFKYIFASKFIYEDDIAVWPGVAINYTTKTQYIFRINKGILNHWDNNRINSYIPEYQRTIPFNRMIFIGDGDTDIPAMKMLTLKGGHSIAVYDPSVASPDKIHQLISDGRVEFVAPTNYEKDSVLDIIVKGILGRMAHLIEYC